MRLTRLRGLGLEAVDEGLKPLAFVGLPPGVLGVEQLAGGALVLEGGISALVEGELAAIEMQNLIDGRVEQVAVVADDDDRARVVRKVVFQPERPFEVEVVGRLVQQQQVGRGKERRRERDAHAPAAREFRAGPGLIRGRESETAQDRRRARRSGMGVDIDETGLDVRDSARIVRGFRLAQ